MSIVSFSPVPRTLMGPGPSDVSPRVSGALARPCIGHLDPQFIDLMDEIKVLLQYAFQTKNKLTIPVSAPGSAGMESCFVNLIEAGDKVIVCQNGAFGGRMKENVERCGGNLVSVDDAWGTAIDPQKVEDALKLNPDTKVLAFVHAETSTGVQSDAKLLCELARKYDCLTIVDAVTSLGGIELDVDGWGIDAIYSGTQKCLSAPPGISPVSFGERAVEKIQNRESRVQSWFLDMNLVMGYWGDGATRAYHHTAPVTSLYALHEALILLREEGLKNAWKRHERHHLALRAGLDSLGLELVVDESVRLPQLNAVASPQGVDEAAVRKALLARYSLEIGAGLGGFAGKLWRIGLMGYACNERNVRLCIQALEATLASMGGRVEPGSGSAAVNAFYKD